MKSCFIAWCLVASFASRCHAEPEIDIPVPPAGYFHVTLLAYAGLRDPVWKIGQCFNTGITNLLFQARNKGYAYEHVCIPKKTGYKGFLVHDATGEQLIVGPETIQLQVNLLDTMPCELPPIGEYRQRIKRVIELGNVLPDCPDSTGNKSYELSHHLDCWNADENTRRKNNGYNYVKDLLSNSFAQPGRASGQIYSKMTGDEIRDAAVRDGLVRLSPHPAASETAPTAPDENSYLVALFVAVGDCHVGGDFHWYRSNNNGTWSHKPGQSGATDLDDANRVITDPRKADTGVYKFVCFMVINRNEANGTRICHGKYGCFDKAEPFNKCLVKLPQKPEDIGTIFKLFTRSDRNNAQVIDDSGKGKLQNSNFNISKRTILVVHGWKESSSSNWVSRMKDALLNREDCNLILVDWHGGSAKGYRQAAGNTRLVGAQIAELIRFVISCYTGSSDLADRFYIVGFSLGAQVAGYAGRHLRTKGMTLGRITGLDPAGPFFNGKDSALYLDGTDAEYVDIIHTDAGFAGTSLIVGDIDFLPNGGSTQPGCNKKLKCDHLRAPEYYIASVENKCSWKAYPFNCLAEVPCNNKERCKICNDASSSMGYYADRTKRIGKYYLKTNAAAPFCAL